MEQTLDLPVQSNPLQHLTKDRIRNNSRKVSLPSKNHLKRNLIGQKIHSHDSHLHSAQATGKMENSLLEQGIQLKLPPPPVPKKPKIHLTSSSIMSSPETKPNHLQNGEEEDKELSKQKPIIAPKPVMSWNTTSSTNKEIKNETSSSKKDLNFAESDHKAPIEDLLDYGTKSSMSLVSPPKKDANDGARFRNFDLNLNGIANNKSSTGSQVKELTSPTKSSMSFSERLKASSLSRRKEANNSDGLQGKFRSQIISPIRRGSRNFLSSDSSLDNESKLRQREPLFKRYSSETSLKIEESYDDDKGDAKEDIDLEKFKNLSLASVDPVAVDSILSPNNSFDEGDITKDSFDSGELFKLGNETSKMKEDDGLHSKFKSSKDINSNQLESNKNHNVSQKQNGQINVYNSIQKGIFDKDGMQKPLLLSDQQNENLHYVNKGSKSLGDATEVGEEDAQFESKLIDHSRLNPTDVIDDSNNHGNLKTEEINKLEKEKIKDTNELGSPRRSGLKFKEGNNFRRKFKPVGMEEATSSSGRNSKIDIGENFGLKYEDSMDKNVIDTVDTDSSLEHVTQDIELDSTFDIIPTSANQVPSNSHLVANKEDNKILNDNKGLVFMPDLSSSSPLNTPEDLADKTDGFEFNFFAQNLQINNANTGYNDDEPFQTPANASNFLPQDTDDFFMQDADFSLETVPSLDVEMLPIVPPPPMDDDAFDSDENMISNIIDPPTVYEDDEMEIATNDDLPSCSNVIGDDVTQDYEIKIENELEEIKKKNDKIVENTFEEVNVKNDDGYDEVDFDCLLQSELKEMPESGLKVEGMIDKTEDIKPIAQFSPSKMNDETSPMTSEYDMKQNEFVSKSNVLSIAKRFDNVANVSKDSKAKSKPVVPAKPANLNKKSIVQEAVVRTREISKFDELSPLQSYEENDGIDNNVLNNSTNEISDKGKERRRSFSDRSMPVVDHDEKADGGTTSKQDDDDYLQEANVKGESLLPSDYESPIFERSNLKQFNKDTKREKEERAPIEFSSESVIANAVYSSRPSLANGHLKDESSSHLDVRKNSFTNQETAGLSPYSSYEHLSDSGKPSSRKSSAVSSNKSTANDDGLEIRRDLSSKRWSSFCSTSSDEQSVEKKVNIVKLMRERKNDQSDGNAGNEDDYDDGNNDVELDFTADSKSDVESESYYVDDFADGTFQDEYDSKFEKTPLNEWTNEDVSDWLEMIGLADLCHIFKEKNIDGQQLQEIDLQLLDEIGITDIEDRELILSEIYSLKNPEDFDIEMSLLDALDSASGYDREKILAVLEALKMSSEDQENRYLPASPPLKLSTGVKQKSPKKKKNDYRRTVSEYTASCDNDEMEEERSKSASPFKMNHYLDSPATNGKSKDKKPSMKKKSFLKEAFSFRRKGQGRLSRLFSSRKKLVDSSLKYMLQSTPQGIVKIWTNGIKDVEINDVPLLITSTTTSLEVTKTVIEKLELAVDVNCYYLVQSYNTKTVPEIVLKEEECPLVVQCRWPDAERYKFELKKHSEGAVIVVFSEDGNDERSITIETMMKTKCAEIISIALKKLRKIEPVNSFSLYQINSSKKQGQSNSQEEAQIPMDAQLLKLAPSALKPAVYKLVRVNFLGSPEKTLKVDEHHKLKINQLENEIKEKEKQLMEAKELNFSSETKLKELTRNNEYLKQKLNDQSEDVARLENIADSLRMEMDEKNEGVTTTVDSKDENEKEMLVKKLSQKDGKIQSLEKWIDNLEKSLQQKEEDRRRLQDFQVKIGSYNNKEINERSAKLKEVEEENNRLKTRIVEVENQFLERNVQFSEREAQLNEENLNLQKEVNNLKKETLTRKVEEEKHGFAQEANEVLLTKLSELERVVESRDQTIASLRDRQSEKEKLDEEVKYLQSELTKKENHLLELDDVSRTNEELNARIISLERSLKQKDQLIADQSATQENMKDFQRKLDLASEEVAIKTKEVEDAKQDNFALRDKLTYDLKVKESEIDGMKDEVNEMRRQKREMEEERKRIKFRMKEIEMALEEKDQRLEELNDVHEDYRGQDQKMKKLERELTMRSDELQKVNLEKDESLEELRNHIESLEQRLIDKDSKILDLEFKIQKSERSLREAENLADDEIREKNRLLISLEDGQQTVKELTKRIDDYKRLVSEKDKIIQNLKSNQNNADEALRRELNTSKRLLIEKERTIEQIRTTFDEERMEMKSRFETLQELVNTKEVKWKEKESRLMRERETERTRCTQIEEKINEKDVTIRKLEAKVAKLEKVARDNMKKFEKFMSDKDRMLRQVKDESQRDISELKSKIRQMDVNLTEKEKHVLQLNRSGSIGREYEMKLKQKEEENKQHKFLLERLMSVVNNRDPGILEEFENSFGQTSKPKDDKRPLLSKGDDDWC